MMRRRPGALTLGLLGGAQVALTALHLPGWPCPMLHATGVPCPGCGLSRACAALVTGHVQHALRLNAMAPFFLAAILLLLLAGMLPDRPKRSLVAAVAWLEGRLGASLLVTIALVAYWAFRLASDARGFVKLIRTDVG